MALAGRPGGVEAGPVVGDLDEQGSLGLVARTSTAAPPPCRAAFESASDRIR